MCGDLDQQKVYGNILYIESQCLHCRLTSELNAVQIDSF